MLDPDLLLVHGIFFSDSSRLKPLRKKRSAIAHARRNTFNQHAAALGLCDYEWLDGSKRALANKALQKIRGTAPTVDAVEIISLNRKALQSSLASEKGRALWREVASCEAHGFATERSFTLMGTPIQQLQGPASGQRIIWLGNGLEELSREEFIVHYTTRHGPLVAGHASLIGLRCYRQVPDAEDALCTSLRELGLGQASPPAVFGELTMGAPSFKLSALRDRRAAMREIKADEIRHIDFSRSMLLLPG